MTFLAPSRPVPAILPDLTERERDVLILVAQGEPNEAIAAGLSVGLKTVETAASED